MPRPPRALLAVVLLVLACTASASAAPVPDLPIRAADPPGAIPAVTAQVVEGLLVARSHEGRPGLQVSGKLTQVAQSHARYMIRHDRFAHSRSLRVAGYRGVGEMLGLTWGRQTSVQPLVSAWLHSPVHRQIMLDPRYRYIGVGSATGTFHGRVATAWVVRYAR